ncbi:16S rRNA (cytidine(1402)-2'-O)-methyltransferase [Lacticaseibacillus nasuensis]|uniref:Ribosomal RNA small subunit methyltransferase I n=1 Tax=Lacticaseibacillus nasuensis JCM 17158 TaxID=1291734 RepID=A0A0R1JMR3_9LACO|nr:16S rRNA (cytidine(1402)-2'-O)-methyltransferase [Lacticaseibacillus nasuensis]KRK70371.1 tetrapyrrole (corrin porphyrin) methyltransferase [Lacticaseibacillus nasuensis JCM 17158]
MSGRQASFGAHDTGTLYLVPTPIGNLGDMTSRAVETLRTVAVIAAEDTRNTQKLLNHFDIATKQISFHEHNTQARIPELIAKLQAGEDIAQVSDAGMPSISDPGHELVNAAIAADIPVVPLPGPNAGLTALIASGLVPQPFLFYGFLPRKASEQRAALTELACQQATMIFYESPYRVVKTLGAMQAAFGDRQAVAARELTKLHEEFLRGRLSELQAMLADTARGEFVVMVAGAPAATPQPSTVPLAEQVAAQVASGLTPTAAIKAVAKANGVKKQVVYADYHGLTPAKESQ